MKKHSKFSPRLFAQVGALALAAVMAVGGTYAMKDFNQHKTNNLNNDNVNINVSLNEDFQSKDNWKQGDSVTKKVNVTNTDKTENAQPVYVRLALKEYMDISKVWYSYANYDNHTRFLTYGAVENTNMTYPHGEYVCSTLEWGTGSIHELAQTLERLFPNTVPKFEDRITGKIHDALNPAEDPNDQTTWSYYIYTQPGDINGQYGKFIVEKVNYDDPYRINEYTGQTDKHDIWAAKKADDGKFNYAPDMHWDRDNYAEGDNWEYYNFNTYLWSDKPTGNYLDPENAIIRDYVTINFNTPTVMSLTDWQKLGSPQGAFWVYDDVNRTNPYVYWAQPLMPGETTANFLESVTLTHQPEYKFFYSIRVDMETVIFDQLAELDGTPEDILKAWIAAVVAPRGASIEEIISMLADPTVKNLDLGGAVITVPIVGSYDGEDYNYGLSPNHDITIGNVTINSVATGVGLWGEDSHDPTVIAPDGTHLALNNVTINAPNPLYIGAGNNEDVWHKNYTIDIVNSKLNSSFAGIIVSDILLNTTINVTNTEINLSGNDAVALFIGSNTGTKINFTNCTFIKNGVKVDPVAQGLFDCTSPSSLSITIDGTVVFTR